MSDYVYTVSIAVQRAFSQALVHYTVVLVSGDESAGAEPSKASRDKRAGKAPPRKAPERAEKIAPRTEPIRAKRT